MHGVVEEVRARNALVTDKRSPDRPRDLVLWRWLLRSGDRAPGREQHQGRY
jgi:hypothetical protein